MRRGQKAAGLINKLKMAEMPKEESLVFGFFTDDRDLTSEILHGKGGGMLCQYLVFGKAFNNLRGLCTLFFMGKREPDNSWFWSSDGY